MPHSATSGLAAGTGRKSDAAEIRWAKRDTWRPKILARVLGFATVVRSKQGGQNERGEPHRAAGAVYRGAKGGALWTKPMNLLWKYCGLPLSGARMGAAYVVSDAGVGSVGGRWIGLV